MECRVPVHWKLGKSSSKVLDLNQTEATWTKLFDSKVLNSEISNLEPFKLFEVREIRTNRLMKLEERNSLEENSPIEHRANGILQ